MVVTLEDLFGETVLVVISGELPDDDALVYIARRKPRGNRSARVVLGFASGSVVDGLVSRRGRRREGSAR